MDEVAVAAPSALTLSAEWQAYPEVYAEGDKLYAEGRIAWLSAVIAAYGNVTVRWGVGKNGPTCTFGNGEVYC